MTDYGYQHSLHVMDYWMSRMFGAMTPAFWRTSHDLARDQIDRHLREWTDPS